MDKREQRVRKDRRKDAKRNPPQKDQEKEIVTQKNSSADSKRNDVNRTDTTTEKNTPKDKVVEDDPLRFANLKRETDEIAALKSKKPNKRQVFSNWSKYEEPPPSLNESQAVDFETLLHAPQAASYFKLKSEHQWDTGTFGQYGELFTSDAELLVAGLTTLPMYTRLCIDKSLLSEDEIKKMDSSAKTNLEAYNKMKQSKQNRKKAVIDLLKSDHTEKYSVINKENEPIVQNQSEENKGKPVFSVELFPEPPPEKLSFARPPPFGTAKNIQSPVLSRESTPAKEISPVVKAQDLSFVRPSQVPQDRPHMQYPSRENTPAKEFLPNVKSQDLSFGQPLQVSYDHPQKQFSSRENTPAPPETSVQERKLLEKVTDNLSATSVTTLPTTVSSDNTVPSKLRSPPPPREDSPFQKDIAIPNGQSVEKKCLNDSNSIPEDNVEERATNSKKEEMLGIEKHDSQQKGKHGRRKKGQRFAAHDGGQQADVEKYPNTTQPMDQTNERTLHDSSTNVKVPTAELTKHLEQHIATVEVRKKPERPPPPTFQQKNLSPPSAVQQELHQSSVPMSVTQDGIKASLPLSSKTQESSNGSLQAPSSDRQDASEQPPTRKESPTIKHEPLSAHRKAGGGADEDHLNFLMSLKGQNPGSSSEVEAAKAATNITVSRSAIEEDELKESQKAKQAPVIATEKKEDLEDWLDSMLDD